MNITCMARSVADVPDTCCCPDTTPQQVDFFSLSQQVVGTRSNALWWCNKVIYNDCKNEASSSSSLPLKTAGLAHKHCERLGQSGWAILYGWPQREVRALIRHAPPHHLTDYEAHMKEILRWLQACAAHPSRYQGQGQEQSHAHYFISTVSDLIES